MKNINKIISTVLALIFLFTITLNVNSNQIYLIQDKNDCIKLFYSFPKPYIENIKIEDEIIHRIKIDGLENSNDYNRAVMPVKNIKILIPYQMCIDEIIVKGEKRELIKTKVNLEYGKKLIPIKNNICINKELKFDSNEKSNNNDLFSMVGNYKLRGFPILYINLYPIQYDIEYSNLFFYENIELEIKLIKTDEYFNIRGIKRDFDLIQKLVDNPLDLVSYEKHLDSLLVEEYEYLIITNNRLLNSNHSNNFYFFAEEKNNRDVKTKIITVEEIVNNSDYYLNGTWGDNNPDNPFYQMEITKNFSFFNDTQAKIRNYIRYAYSNLGVDYVLLGGDADRDNDIENIIPCRGLFANESGLPLHSSFILDEEEDDIPSDIYYSNLDGNFNYDLDNHFGESPDRNDIAYIDEADLLSEIYVGRACVDSVEEVSNFVMKTLSYQNLEDDPYFSKILFVGEYLGFPGVSLYGGNYKDLIIPIIPDNYNIVKLYDRDLSDNWDKNDIIDIINIATPHIINHDGHSYYGYNMRMSNGDIDKLSNTNYFFAYSHGCMAGGFDNPAGYDCIAEYFTVGSPYGAFGVIMNARYGLGSEDSLDSPSQFLDESFFKALFTENIRQVGRANHYSKEDNIWRINENGVRWVYYETNLFGDPEISIKNPNESNIYININITHPEEKFLYVLNTKICRVPILNYPLIIGDITILSEINSSPEGQIYYVEFLLDNESIIIDKTYPYELDINSRLFGIHNIKINVYTYNGKEKSKDIDILIFNV
jgi:hypothetical protein